MKKYLLMMFLVLGLVSPAFAANFIANPGFENGFTSWKDLFGSPTQITNTQQHLGSYSASKTVTSVTGQDYWSQLYQDVALTAGQPVYAKIFIKTTFSPEATAHAGLMIQYLNSSNVVIGSTLTAPISMGGTQTWRAVEVSGQSAPAGTVKARLSGFIWAAQGDTLSLNNGKAYFDDASLTKVFKALAAQKKLLNADFENGLNDWLDPFGTPATLDKTIKYEGVYAAKKTITSVSTQDYWSQLYQDIVVGPNKNVTATLFVKTNFDVTSQGVAGLQIDFLDANNVVIATDSDSISGVTNWQQKKIVIPVTPAGTAKVRFSAFVFAPQGDVPSVNGVAYFDKGKITIK